MWCYISAVPDKVHKLNISLILSLKQYIVLIMPPNRLYSSQYIIILILARIEFFSLSGPMAHLHKNRKYRITLIWHGSLLSDFSLLGSVVTLIKLYIYYHWSVKLNIRVYLALNFNWLLIFQLSALVNFHIKAFSI